MVCTCERILTFTEESMFLDICLAANHHFLTHKFLEQAFLLHIIFTMSVSSLCDPDKALLYI